MLSRYRGEAQLDLTIGFMVPCGRGRLAIGDGGGEPTVLSGSFSSTTRAVGGERMIEVICDGQLREGGHTVTRGTFVSGLEHGHCVRTENAIALGGDLVYAGKFHRGLRHGAGVVTWPDGAKSWREYSHGVLVSERHLPLAPPVMHAPVPAAPAAPAAPVPAAPVVNSTAAAASPPATSLSQPSSSTTTAAHVAAFGDGFVDDHPDGLRSRPASPPIGTKLTFGDAI
jgi:hypothetical protein